MRIRKYAGKWKACLLGWLAQTFGSSSLEGQAESIETLVLSPDTELGQYKIETEIGSGGMGVVFRAHDTKLHRPVAIKFLSDDLADAMARAVFSGRRRWHRR